MGGRERGRGERGGRGEKEREGERGESGRGERGEGRGERGRGEERERERERERGREREMEVGRERHHTFQPVRHPVLDFDVDKEHGQWQRLGVTVAQRDMSEAGLNCIDGEETLSDELSVIGQTRQHAAWRARGGESWGGRKK